MLCFRDTTFCISENCTCGRKLTKEIEEAAEKWWNPEGLPEKRGQAPIAVAVFCSKA